MKRAELAFLIGIFLTIALTGMVRFYAAAQSLGQETLRLHILANSDSGQDQQLKLKVRDRLLEEGGQLFLRQDSLSGAEEEVQAHLDEIEALCDRVLREEGAGYRSRAELVRMYFDTREYEEFLMPAGRYDALRITLGEGEGHNWWCVMFPPMCLEAAQAENTPTGQKILSLSEEPLYRPKFAVVEWIEGLKERFSSPEEQDGIDKAAAG